MRAQITDLRHQTLPKIYSAQWVCPISAPLIRNGAVAIDAPTIIGVGALEEIVARFPECPIEKFGDAAILPGLINTHSHLELTVMRGYLESEEHDFFAWLRQLTIARMSMTNDDLLVSATCGVIEAARAGITCIGDSSSFGVQSMMALKVVGLRGIVYQESFGPDPKLAEQNVTKLRTQLDEMRACETDMVRAGVSPHAPYTVSGPQLELIARLAIAERLPLMMHAAESRAEQEFILSGTGPFAEGLRKRGIDWQSPRVSTVQYLKDRGILETKPLLAHCIRVDDHDLELIKQSGAGIAHCPKSNAKLGHGHAPFAKFVAQELNVGLGSDSVASNNTCDIMDEARVATLVARVSEVGPSGRTTINSNIARDDFAVALPDGRDRDTITAEQALFAATLGGARALSLDNQIGALREGMQADIAVVNLSGAHQQPYTNPTDALIFSSSGRDVILTMVSGQEVYRNNCVGSVDETSLRHELQSIRDRFASSG